LYGKAAQKKPPTNPNPPSLFYSGGSRNGKEGSAWALQEAKRLQQDAKPSPSPARPWQKATSVSHPPLIRVPYALKALAESSLPLFLTGKDNPDAFIPGSGTGDLKEK